MGPARAALVHDDDVMAPADAREHRRRAAIESAGAQARTAGEDEQRLGRGLAAERRNPGHEQLQLPPGRTLRILGHGDMGALGLHGGESQRVFQFAAGEDWRGSGRRRRGGPRDVDCCHDRDQEHSNGDEAALRHGAAP